MTTTWNTVKEREGEDAAPLDTAAPDAKTSEVAAPEASTETSVPDAAAVAGKAEPETSVPDAAAVAGKAEPETSVHDVAANAGKAAPAPAPKKWRRRLRLLGYVVIVLAALSGSLVLLVRWSVREHERLMLESAADPDAIHKRMLLESASLGGRHNQYRGPGIIVTPTRALVAFAEGRQSDDDFSRIEVVGMRSDDLGANWSDLVVVKAQKEAAIGSPTPVVDQQTGTIWLAYRITRRLKGRMVSSVSVMPSTDDGKTWGAPIDLTEKSRLPRYLAREVMFAVGSGHGIQLERGKHAGRLILTGNAVTDTNQNLARGEVGTAFVFYSDDHGKTWQISQGTDYGGENQVVEASTGDLLMLIRTRASSDSKRMKRLAWSRDGGATWGPTQESTTLKEPVCQHTLLWHPKGGRDGKPGILFIQPDGQAKGRWDKSARHHLTVWLSEDDGKTWPRTRLLHSGGVSYSDAAVGPDGRIHVLFEVGMKSKPWGGAIMYSAFDVNWVHPLLGKDRPFSEWVFDVYQEARAPIEEKWRRDR